MLSNRPYLLRAFYQWIVDSHCTPILVVNAHDPRCKIPRQYIEGDEILFNISSDAIRDLKILNESIEFKATFSGIIHIISVPIQSVLAVYAEENGEGLYFDEEGSSDSQGGANMEAIQAEPHKKTTTTKSTETGASSGFTARDPKPDPKITSNKKSKPFLKLVE